MLTGLHSIEISHCDVVKLYSPKLKLLGYTQTLVQTLSEAKPSVAMRNTPCKPALGCTIQATQDVHYITDTLHCTQTQHTLVETHLNYIVHTEYTRLYQRSAALIH